MKPGRPRMQAPRAPRLPNDVRNASRRDDRAVTEVDPTIATIISVSARTPSEAPLICPVDHEVHRDQSIRTWLWERDRSMAVRRRSEGYVRRAYRPSASVDRQTVECRRHDHGLRHF